MHSIQHYIGIKNTEKITNPEDIKDLESLRLTMMDDWYGYQYSTLGGWKQSGAKLPVQTGIMLKIAMNQGIS